MSRESLRARVITITVLFEWLPLCVYHSEERLDDALLKILVVERQFIDLVICNCCLVKVGLRWIEALRVRVERALRRLGLLIVVQAQMVYG